MRRLGLIALLSAAASPSSAEPRRLTLPEAVALALRAEPLVAEAHIAEGRSQLAVLRAQLDRVSLRIDGQLQELWSKSGIGTDPSPEGGLGLMNLSASLNVPIFSGLRVEANVTRAQRLAGAASASLAQQRKDTALAVARAYWSVRRLGLIAEAQAATIARLAEAEGVAEGRVRAGLAPPIDRNRATLRHLQQAAVLADLRGQLRENSAQLAVALGLSDELSLTDAPTLADSPLPPAQELLDGAHHCRPELRNAQLQLAAQQQAVRMARSNYFPQLSGFALLQYGNNPYLTAVGARAPSSAVNPFANGLGNLQLGVSLSMNFFDTLHTFTAIRDAQHEEARLAEELRRVGRVVEAEVRVAHARLIHLHEQRAPLVAARAVSADNLTILAKRYQNGEALVIEFLDSQVDLANVERQLADVTAQLQLASLELDGALGRVVGEER